MEIFAHFRPLFATLFQVFIFTAVTFSPSSARAQTPSFNNGILVLPQVAVANIFYSAQLQLTKASPLEFRLTSAEVLNSTNTLFSASFQNGEVSIPSVQVGAKTYAATLELINATPLEFRLKTASDTTVTARGLFEKSNPWNQDISQSSVASRSLDITSALQAMGGWGGNNKLQIDFSIALLFADSSTPRRTVTGLVNNPCDPDCETFPVQLPAPTNGNTENSSNYACDINESDCHVLVVERSQKKLYELYQANGSAADFTAQSAYVWDLAKEYTDVLRGEQCTSADAAGLPIAAFLPTADEVAAGEVAHALRFILPNSRMKKRVYVHPATHAGAPSSTNPNAPPYGLRLRLKQSFDETAFTPGAQVILKAMKKYGMILSDGGNIALTFADDRLSTAKWAALGINSQTFSNIGVNNFEVVELGEEIPLTYDCIRVP